MNYAGRHMLLELWGVDNKILTNCKTVSKILEASARKAKATILHNHFHHFGEGYGVTGVIVLAESHISIHTWPERNYAAIDVFMCGECNPEDTLGIIFKRFKPTSYEKKLEIRGKFPDRY